MSAPILRHQQLNYNAEKPFGIYRLKGVEESQNYLPHWHEELEIVCYINGHACHFIDGIKYEGANGDIIVTNSGSIHSIKPSFMQERQEDSDIVVLLIGKEFVEQYLPEYKTNIFTGGKKESLAQVYRLMMQLIAFDEKSADASEAHANLYELGFILQILFYLCKAGMEKRENITEINSRKDLERLRGVIQFVENNYMRRITQKEIADTFYFSKEYFSRYFSQAMGMAFTEYLTFYRVEKARVDLLNTDFSILEIAVQNGFSDGRLFSEAFKKRYNVLPSKYRKIYKKI